jgi:poly(ADP-ribose) glycohydrolase ARH3
MRVTPISLWSAGRPTDVADLARRSARVTHDHPSAVEGAVAQAVAVTAALRHPVGAPIDATELVATVRRAVSDAVLAAKLDVVTEVAERGRADELAARIGSGLLAVESVPAAICAFLSHPDSFPAAVTMAVSVGGDTDTIASMTGAIAGALLGETSIPARWLERTTLTTRARDLADALHTAATGESSSSPAS